MIAGRAILKVNNLEYDILRFNHKFQRDIDAKGRPCSNYYGGEISVMLESTDSIQLFQQMVHKDMPTIDGSIEVLSGNAEDCIRRIEFKEAYIYAYGENMQSYSSLPMTTTVMISPMRLDFNNNMLRLDRLWPRAKHGWQKYESEEMKYAKVAPDDTPDTEVSEIEILTPLTKRDSNSNAGMELGKTYRLRVKNYTNGVPANLNSIRWEYSYNSNKADADVVIGAIIGQRGPEIEFTLNDNGAMGNLISFYAHISKQKEEGRCRAYVNPLWRYKGTKEWGQLGTGLERQSQQLSLREMNEQGLLDNAGYLRAEYLSHLPEQAVKNIYEGKTNLTGVRQVLSDDDDLQARVLNSFYTGSEPKMSFGPASYSLKS